MYKSGHRANRINSQTLQLTLTFIRLRPREIHADFVQTISMGYIKSFMRYPARNHGIGNFHKFEKIEFEVFA